MSSYRRHTRSLLLGATALVGALALNATPASAQERQYSFDVPAQPLETAVQAFARQAQQQVIFSDADMKGVTAPRLSGSYSADEALALLIAGTDLEVRRTASGVLKIAADAGPQGGSADDGSAVEALIVTAQKREEAIQDVPIAISAFTQKALEEQKIEGGFDLLKAIPNVSFSKSNFTSYNFSIRGIGTKAISATTDPGVAVAFNNTTLIQNRLFEQEYFDVERVEVLRGPQGTLYGRNATSGVINVISAKPKLHEFEGSLKLEVGNYDTKRVVGMVNLPLVEDILAVRLAGSMTQRTGYDFNEITGNNVNGRDLWSGRITVGFEPVESVRATLLWEHFEEDDNRSRTGKQLCKRDPGPQFIGSVPTVNNPDVLRDQLLGPATYSQGCLPVSLYDDAAFGTVNGMALPFIFATLALGADCGPGCSVLGPIGQINGLNQSFLKVADPYGGLEQSRDLRTVASVLDPVYRAKADVFDLSVSVDINDALTFTSQTVYNKDEVYSFQDYNRFNSAPAFIDSSLLTQFGLPSPWVNLTPGGVFCDPQIGCTDRIAGFDVSQGAGEQFSQEVRLQSSFDGPLNFSVGANYTAFETLIDYYVFYNVLTGLALTPPFYRPIDGAIDFTVCPFSGFYVPAINDVGGGVVPAGDPAAACPYIDPNPIESINGEGHNYFRSKNPYELRSRAIFGELYWNLTEALKLTAGLRYTDDSKTFTPVPSQVLLGAGLLGGGVVARGYPEKDPIVQHWGEWTGRFGLDWKPVLGFTDETLLYAFYSRGYKGGGANPPTPGFATKEESLAFFIKYGAPQFYIDSFSAAGRDPILNLTAVDYGRTFEPEFVNAFEVGAKNTLLNGAMTLNITGFFYDYKDYQVSQIKDRTAVNENFDAKIWGLEFEALYAPTRDLRFNANLGLLDTEIADGETSIDIMDRTQSNPDYIVTKPWLQLPSNCVLPTVVAESALADGVLSFAACGGFNGVFGSFTQFVIDPATGEPFTFDDYPELNGGAGLRAQLGGNELPNAPHITTNIGAQYGFDIGSWRASVRTDAYWQSQSWARVYNAVNDKLHGWYNVNLSVWVEQPDWGLRVELYAKNLLDKTPITDAFLNSDDSGLTTNVFVLDPRLIGLNIRKTF